MFSSLTREERDLFRSLSTPAKLQDYLDTMPFNHEKKGDTWLSPRLVLKHKKAHCLEGALFAAAALKLAGEKPLLMNLRTLFTDDDHALALYKVNGYWGAISKTNHAVLRFRDPVYASPRELALSYFHEYFINDTGLKTLRAYSKPFSLAGYGNGWITSEKSLRHIAETLRDSPHVPIFPKENRRHLRHAGPIERKAGHIVEWPLRDPRT